MLVIVPALRALAEAFPEHCRVLAAPAAWANIVGLADAIDVVVPTGRHTWDWTPFDPLPFVEADVAVNLHGAGPECDLVLQRLKPRMLIAYACDELGIEGPAWREEEYEVDRWCRLLRWHGIDADPARLDLRTPPPRHDAARGAIIVHPGAGSPARMWPLRNWVAVIEELRHRGVRVAITGSRDEREYAENLARATAMDRSAVLAGLTEDTLDLARVIAHARGIVCGDTGVAHLATAFGTPSVVLFGPSSPAAWGPPPDRVQHRVVWRGTVGHAYADCVDPGLAQIPPEEVIDALEAVGAL